MGKFKIMTPRNEEHVNKLLAEVWTERAAQDGVWGEQHHPLGTDEGYVSVAAHWRSTCDAADSLGIVTWRDILLEEVYEALAETDPQKARAELIQVAAVALSMVEDIDLRGAQ
jgi:hypothetical protein